MPNSETGDRETYREAYTLLYPPREAYREIYPVILTQGGMYGRCTPCYTHREACTEGTPCYTQREAYREV